MKSMWKYMLVPLVAAVTASGAFAQVASQGGNGGNSDALNFNHPPCDFSDDFYQGNPASGTLPDGTLQVPGNGMNVSVLNEPAQQRFGIFRQFGPPATGAQKNWVADPTCSQNDPTKKDVRILATTGGYSDDGTINANQFINIIAFLTTPKVFSDVPNKRNTTQQELVNNFEAYVNLKQRQPDGTFLNQPCGSLSTSTGAADPVLPTATPTPLNKPGVNCFSVASAATPALASNWRFGSDRNAIDNLAEPHNDPFGLRGASLTTTPPNPGGNPASVPYGYFCDDLLGTWVVVYFWFTFDPLDTSANAAPCIARYQSLAKTNGTNLDGGPVIKVDPDLDGTEDVKAGDGTPCAQQGTLAMNGSDGGAIWLICPTIVDPRNGAIAKDAFLDQVVFPNGQPVDPSFALNFNCLQQKGQFPGQSIANGFVGTDPTTGAPIPQPLQPATTINGTDQNTGTTAAATGGATAGGPIGDGSEPTGACVQGTGSL